MSDSRPCTIQMAFPLIPEDTLRAMLPDSSPRAPITSLVESSEADVSFELIAEWMMRKLSLCLGTTLPGLWLARDEAIGHDDIPDRVVAALASMSIAVWGDVIELTPSIL